MLIFPFLKVSLIWNVIAVLWALCALILVLVILIQKGKGGGLSGSLVGGMAGGILGSKTGDFLTWVTIVLVGIFLFLSVGLAKFYKPTSSDIGVTEPAVQTRQTETTIPESTEPSEETAFPEIPESEGIDTTSDDLNSLGG